jgi:hypothetical protein
MTFMHFGDHPKLTADFITAETAIRPSVISKTLDLGKENLFLLIQDFLCNSGTLHDKQ